MGQIRLTARALHSDLLVPAALAPGHVTALNKGRLGRLQREPDPLLSQVGSSRTGN